MSDTESDVSRYDSDYSTDDDAPYPTEPAPVSYKRERLYILTTLRKLGDSIRYLDDKLAELKHK